MGYSAKTALVTTLFFLAFISLISCGGGSSSGGGGGTTPVAAPTQTVVSGTVQAPGGAIAFFKQPSLGDLFESEAYAALTGLANVPDNTIVQLARLNATATSFSVISTTTTSGGRYSFNLSALGIQPANDLIVRVTGPSGREMRAFVIGTVADISPVSEAGYQLAIQSLNGGPISNLTFQEVGDISGAVALIAMLQNIGNATSIDQAVGLVTAAVGTNAQVTGFIAAAVAPGQTTQGPGDQGNYYPLSQGNRWNYQASITRNGGASTLFQNSVSVNGITTVNGIQALIYLESNSENEGIPLEEYITKDSAGIILHGNNNAAGVLTPLITPLRTVRFPPNLGTKTTTFDRKQLPLSFDLDGDGTNDLVDIQSEYSAISLETITVPAGTFPNCLRAEEKTTRVFHSSAFGITATLTSIETNWRGTGVGVVKRTETTQSEGFVQDITQFVTEELTGSIINGSGIGGVAATRVLPLATNDIVYDSVSRKLYASISGTPGRIQPIDPENLSFEIPILVGNDPNRLALSDDGQYLYVGLDGDAAIQRIHIPTRMAEPIFPLPMEGVNPGCGRLTAEDIAVVPGRPSSVAVSRYQSGCISSIGVTILDDGVPRPLSTSLVDRTSRLEFSDSPSILYGFDSHTSNYAIRTMSVTPQGLTVVDVASRVFSIGSNEIKFGSGKLFEQFGRVYDPISKTIIGSLAPFGSIVAVFPDPALGKAFSVAMPELGTLLIQSNDIHTLQVIGSARIEGFYSPADGPGPSLIRWGSDGLAFRAQGDRIVFVRSALVR